MHLFSTMKQVALIRRGGSTRGIYLKLYCHMSNTGKKNRHLEQREKCRFNKWSVLCSLIMKGKVMAHFQEYQKSTCVVYVGTESIEGRWNKCG